MRKRDVTWSDMEGRRVTLLDWMPTKALGLALLCGCAATSRSSMVAPMDGPDCSFRSATTCWTMVGRFPSRRAQARDSVPDELLTRPPTVLATGADTAAVR